MKISEKHTSTLGQIVGILKMPGFLALDTLRELGATKVINTINGVTEARWNVSK